MAHVLRFVIFYILLSQIYLLKFQKGLMPKIKKLGLLEVILEFVCGTLRL